MLTSNRSSASKWSSVSYQKAISLNFSYVSDIVTIRTSGNIELPSIAKSSIVSKVQMKILKLCKAPTNPPNLFIMCLVYKALKKHYISNWMNWFLFLLFFWVIIKMTLVVPRCVIKACWTETSLGWKSSKSHLGRLPLPVLGSQKPKRVGKVWRKHSRIPPHFPGNWWSKPRVIHIQESKANDIQ